ncbi:M23 family metallopeptidase [Clostridium sp.]|uniref:M23 family metallopeptidase n=1 Tax=Clostridium sp. TaxID=1506 RepID=UPI0026359F2D|nr:M23 family metallopeptidase [Clostridium sp.]
MSKRSKSDSIIKKIILLILVVGVILNFNQKEVNAKVNNTNEKNNNYKIVNTNTLFDNIYEVITGKANAYEVKFAEKVVGYISIDSNLKNIKDLILKKHLKKLNISDSLVLSFDVEGDFKLEKNKISYEFFETEEAIANKIYNISKDYPDELRFNIKYIEENDIEIKPSTVIIPTEEMFVGESKVVEGETGLRKQIVEVMSKNGEITLTNIIKDNIIKEEISKKVYRGTKNPYDYGIAFLNAPTRGGYLTSGYGERWNSFHKGIDIGGTIGDDVLVALDGEVTYAEFNDGGYGNLIIVKHDNDMTTYYGHLDNLYAKVGDLVKKGDIIGALGNTGFSTGPHLHFELRVSNNPVDPSGYIIQ